MRYLIIITSKEQKIAALTTLFRKGYTWMSNDRRLDRGKNVKYLNVNDPMIGKITYGNDEQIKGRLINSGGFIVLSPERVNEVPSIVTMRRK
jgi:hypothetical protein